MAPLMLPHLPLTLLDLHKALKAHIKVRANAASKTDFGGYVGVANVTFES